MIDIPFAEMLEETIKEVADSKAQNLAVCGRLEDGSTLTAFANMVAEDKAIIAWHILSAAILEVVLNNIDMIKDALEKYEEGEDE